MARATQARVPLSHRDAMISIAAALAELEEWRSGVREHANATSLRSHVEEIDARARDSASEHPEFARLQRERDDARALLEAERANLRDATTERDRLRAQLQEIAIPNDAERKAQQWDAMWRTVPRGVVGWSYDTNAAAYPSEDDARLLVRDAVAMRRFYAHCMSVGGAKSTRYGECGPDGASLSIVAEIHDAAEYHDDTAEGLSDALVKGIDAAQKSWNDDVEQYRMAVERHRNDHERVEAWNDLAIGLGLRTTDPLYFGAAASARGITRHPTASVEDIGEEIAARLERVS